MLSHSELEGEVDHSFFDSDGDDSRGNIRENVEKSLNDEKKSPTAPAKHTGKGNLSPRTERTNKHLKPMANKWSKAISESSESEEDSNLPPKSPSRTFMALVADDVYNQSPNRTAEKALACSASSKKKNKQFPKVSVKSQHLQIPSSTLTCASGDADSESSCSCQGSNLGSPSFPKPAKSSLLHEVRRVDLAGSEDLPALGTDESDDTVTDVSPLSSPELSSHRSLDLNCTGVEKRNQQQQRQASLPSSGPSSMHHEEDSDQDLDERSVCLESLIKPERSLHCPGWRNRKNYSFSNDEIQRIERENRRLLQELMRPSPVSRSGKTAVKKSSVACNSPVAQISHSALNRQREQKRIDRENLVFLKRLESVKPTPGLKRSEQLADYQRLTRCPAFSSHPIFRPIANRGRSSSRTSTVITRPRPGSSRATFTNTESSSTPVPGSKTPRSACPPRAEKTTI